TALLVGQGDDAGGAVLLGRHRLGDRLADRARGGIRRGKFGAKVKSGLLVTEGRGPRLGTVTVVSHVPVRPPSAHCRASEPIHVPRDAAATPGCHVAPTAPQGPRRCRLYATSDHRCGHHTGVSTRLTRPEVACSLPQPVTVPEAVCPSYGGSPHLGGLPPRRRAQDRTTSDRPSPARDAT